MLDQRALRRDVFALGLAAAAVLLVVSLASYDRADPPGSFVWPASDQIHNACGRAGAWAAHLLFQAFGLGAFYVALSILGLAVALATRPAISDPWLRGFGWLLSLAGLTTLAAMAVPEWSPGPVIGAGGYSGALGRALLEHNLATAGAYLLTISLVVAGLLLATDYLLVRTSAIVVRAPARGLGRGLAGAGRHARHLVGPGRMGSTPLKSTDIDDLDAEDEEDAEDEPAVLPVKIAGRNRVETIEQDDTDDSADEETDESEETEGDNAEAAEAQQAPSGGLPALLRIRRKSSRVGSAGETVRGPASSDERARVMQTLDAASLTDAASDYRLPSVELLQEGEEIHFEEHEKEVRRKAKILEKTFANFGFNVKVVEIETGPVIAQFEVELEAGLRLSRITGLADDLAIALRVPSVRIVAPIPGKNTVGIEVPNAERQVVRLREVIEETNGRAQRMRIPIYLGKDVSGNPMIVDLSTLPHLLIAGRTGTGKSVCLNSIIVSMLMTRRPDEVRMLLIDPKMVELSPYKTLPHLMHPVVTDMRKAEAMLAWAVEKMEERYALLARAGVRHIAGYNQLGEEELVERLQPETDEERAQIPTHLPYIVIVADEMADLMMTAAKEVEAHIIRLAQKSRAVGIHLVLATQKPTVDVITGLIKSNLPARIAFQVASRTDSRVVLDEMGADKLLGNGDLLFLWPGTSTLIRGQGTYVSDEEINSIVACVGTSEPAFVPELVELKPTAPADAEQPARRRDDLYDTAVEIVIREGRGSVSLLQRALGIGYGRAARLIDYMAEDGIVGDYNGSQAREVVMSLADWQAISQAGAEGAAAPTAVATAAPPAPRRPRNRILPEPEWDSEEEESDELEEEADEEQSDSADEADDEDAPFGDEEDSASDEWDEEESDELDEEESDEESDADLEDESDGLHAESA